jgi:uncharacterized protein (DUF302 family)
MYISVNLPQGDFQEAIEKVKVALKEEQFGVLTSIDVKATMKEKLDADFRNYVILGACNPPFAHKVLTINDKVGVLLPCNVCLQELDDRIEVFAMDPRFFMANDPDEDMRKVAAQVGEKLDRVLAGLTLQG